MQNQKEVDVIFKNLVRRTLFIKFENKTKISRQDKPKYK